MCRKVCPILQISYIRIARKANFLSSVSVSDTNANTFLKLGGAIHEARLRMSAPPTA